MCFHLGCQQGRFCCSFSKTPKSRGRGDPAPTADFQGCRVADGEHPELLSINKIIQDVWGDTNPITLNGLGIPNPAAGVLFFPEPGSFLR